MELRQHVNRPVLKTLHYRSTEADVDVVRFRDGNFVADKRLQKVWRNVSVLVEELGWWAGLTFVHDLVATLTESLSRAHDQLGSFSVRRKLALLEQLKPTLRILDNFYDRKYEGRLTYVHVSEKVRVLIGCLNDLSRNEGEARLSGILFARQRIVVAMLQKLLSHHPEVSAQIRSAPLVGRCGSTIYEQEPSELLIPRTQVDTMQNFRLGAINLIISTDALDEGIDVSACNTIVCFDEPMNLRSYVQKRGRARQKRSVFVLMVPGEVSKDRGGGFEAAEANINRMFDEEDRRAARAQAVESVEEPVSYILESPHTGFVRQDTMNSLR